MPAWEIIEPIIVVLGFVVSCATLWYVWRQDRDAKRQKEEDVYWSERFNKAVALLITVGHRNTTNSATMIFNLLNFNIDQKTRIDQYLIRMNWATNIWNPLPLALDQLRLPAVRQTITDVLNAFEDFKKREPDHAKLAGL
jgi:hypothetical protein